MVLTAGCVRSVANGPDSAWPVVVCEAKEAKLCTAAARLLPASHVVASPALLDPVAALRALLRVDRLKVLQQRDLVRLQRTCVVLRAPAAIVPWAPVEGAGAALALEAPHEHVAAAFDSRTEAVDQLPAAAAGVRAPAEVGILIEHAAQNQLVEPVVEHRRTCLPHILVAKNLLATDVHAEDPVKVALHIQLHFH